MKEQWDILETSSTHCRKCGKPLFGETQPKMISKRIIESKLYEIIFNLIEGKLSEKELETLLRSFNPMDCPCMIIHRFCDDCQYKTVDQRKENRHHSGCMDAIEYHLLTIILLDDIQESMITELYKDILEEYRPKLFEEYKHLFG